MAGRVSTSVVKDGLILYLDAANTKSYPGSGTVWTDLSRRVLTASLVGSPVFSGSNNGSLTFNGTVQYVNCGTSPTDTIRGGTKFTIGFWTKKNNSSSESTIGSWYHATRQGFALQLYSDNNLYLANSSGGSNNNVVSLPHTNDWYYLVGVFDGGLLTNADKGKIYVNGLLRNQTSSGLNTNTVSTYLSNLWIGSLEGYGVYTNGNISNVQLYNRALSATEILQNYNATKSRFGL